MAKRKYSNWNPKKIGREAKEWLERESGPEGRLEKSEKEIEMAMVSGDETLIGGHIAFRLEMASLHYVHVAELRIAAGDMSGWAEMKRAFRYKYWAIRILIRLWELDQRRTKQERVYANDVPFYALAVSVGASDEVGWLGDRMNRSIEDGAFGSWDSGHLPSFLLTLHLRSTGNPDALIVPQTWGLGPYSDVFKNWNSISGTKAAIIEMAEYHLDHTCNSDEEFTEFTLPPFIHTPVEIITLEKVRAKLGLETVRPDHELFSTPFANPPDEIADIDDPFLNRVIEYVTEAINP